MIARRTFVSASFAVATLRATRVRAQPAPMKLRVAAIPIDVGALSYFADAQAFFQKHGLDVDVITGQNGAAVAAAVAGGSLDIGDGNTSAIALAHQNGIPFVFVGPSGAYSSKSPTSAIVVYKDGPIKNAADLVGKTVGVGGLESIGQVAFRAWLDKNHIPQASVQFIEIAYSQMGPALQSGRIAAALAEEPWVAVLLNSDVRIIARPYDLISPLFLEGGFFCTADFAKSRPDVVKRFADAMAETAVWANGHRAETAAILDQHARSKLPPNVVRIYFPPRVTPALIQPVIDASAKYGLLKNTFPATDIIAPGIGA